jgi:predicted nucleic acid-binding protein
MSIFVDTSGLMAVLDARDERHVVAHATWRELLDSVPDLVTHKYAVAEAFALVQNRIGMDAVRALHDEIPAPVGIEATAGG